jgi:glycosyltransferase involved in cell wall biosynthesis
VSSAPLVLHVTTTPISLVLLLGPQLRAFRDSGYRVETASAAGPEAEQLRDWGLEHHALRHATRSSAPVQDLLALRELHRLFRTLRPDVVHTHNPKPGVYGRLAAAAARVPAVVNTVHGLYAQPTDPWRRRAIVYTLERVAAACSDAELVQNPEDLETLARLGVPRERLTLLGNGVDLERFRPQAVPPQEAAQLRESLGCGPDDVLVCVVGRLVWEKGYRELFTAASLLQAEGSPVRFAVVGPPDASKDDRVDEESVRRAERDGVRFLGFRDDMPLLYAASDVFVLASHREGFPRAAMEAAAMGLPVVATDVRGCRQVVDDGRSGLLVPVRDAAALATAIRALAASPDLRSKMGAAALTKARREFDQSRVVDTTLSVYSRLLGGRSGAA